MLTDEEKQTVEYYDKHSLEWVEKHGNNKAALPDMEKLFELVSGGKILEIGVGSGKDAKLLINHFGINNYIGIEPALGLLRIAKKKNPKAKFINLSIYDIDFPSGYFDSFWISAMIIHIPKNKLVIVLKKIRKYIKKGSYGYFSVMEGNSDMEENRNGRYYSLWSQEEFEKDLKRGGFEVFRLRRLVPDTGSPWLGYIVKTS